MFDRAPRSTQKQLLNNPNSLLVLRKPSLPPPPAPGQPGVSSTYLPEHDDIFIAITDYGIYAFNGHVDLGTDIQTALAQIVADELDVKPEQVTMVLGHTNASPNQGPTIASASNELAHAAHQDPVAFRVKHLHEDPRAQDLILAVAKQANWETNQSGSRGNPAPEGWMHGRGIAYAHYIHSKFPGFGSAWSAWVLDLKVHIRTGQMINPAGVRHQIHGNVIQSLSRTLFEAVQFNEQGVTSLEWGAYPILKFTDLPEIKVLLLDRQDEEPLGSGESASLPCAPAVANALFDATNCRFYEAPFTPDRILRTLNATHHTITRR